MKVFVTGGSGLLGQALLRRLHMQGHGVQALARSSTAADTIRRVGGAPMIGDLGSVAEVDLKGIDAVVHAAAPVLLWGPWEMYEREIVQASLALFRRAADAGVRRFVYVSSESVLQGTEPLLDIDESQPYADPPTSDYGRAKKAAEIALLQAWRASPQCELVILRPAFIWGPRAPAVLALLERARRGRFVWIDRGAAPFERVHVDNAALAVECVLQREHAGGIYLITDDERSSLREFLGAVFEAAGQRVPTRSLPGRLVQPVAQALESTWRALDWMDRPPPLTRFELAFVSQPRRYRIDAARRELGYQPRAYSPGV
jgi:nucleoside-diphosphate-sugar epimerase